METVVHEKQLPTRNGSKRLYIEARGKKSSYKTNFNSYIAKDMLGYVMSVYDFTTIVHDLCTSK